MGVANLLKVSVFSKINFENKTCVKSTNCCQTHIAVRLLTQLHLGLNQLRKHKIKHSFQDSLNPSSNQRKDETKPSFHYFINCSKFSESKIGSFKIFYLISYINDITKILLFAGNNILTLIATIKVFIVTEKFNEPLLTIA